MVLIVTFVRALWPIAVSTSQFLGPHLTEIATVLGILVSITVLWRFFRPKE
jgi:hypothetical protein